MKRKKCHAMNYVLEVLCGTKHANITSIIGSKGLRDPLADLVTCKRCRRKLRS
jgi:hypothetical protein